MANTMRAPSSTIDESSILLAAREGLRKFKQLDKEFNDLMRSFIDNVNQALTDASDRTYLRQSTLRQLRYADEDFPDEIDPMIHDPLCLWFRTNTENFLPLEFPAHVNSSIIWIETLRVFLMQGTKVFEASSPDRRIEWNERAPNGIRGRRTADNHSLEQDVSTLLKSMNDMVVVLQNTVKQLTDLVKSNMAFMRQKHPTLRPERYYRWTPRTRIVF